MSEKPDISIIIPFLNEKDNLPVLYTELKEVLGRLNIPSEIIFIDDGSRDGSSERVQAVCEKDDSVRLIKLNRNFGQTAAISAGFDYAEGEFIVPMDGDLQNDPADIPKLLSKLNEGYDVVSGWRKNRRDKTISRKLPSLIANFVISWISGVHLHDYGCTLKAYKKNILREMRLYSEMHRFIPIYAHWSGGRVTEIPVNHRARRWGASKVRLGRTFKVIMDLIVIKFLSNYLDKPIYLFGGFGFLSLLGAFLAGCWALWLKYVRHWSFISTPLPLLTVLLTVLGVMAILMGLLAELVMRTYHESQNKQTYSIKEIISFGKKEPEQIGKAR